MRSVGLDRPGRAHRLDAHLDTFVQSTPAIVDGRVYITALDSPGGSLQVFSL